MRARLLLLCGALAATGCGRAATSTSPRHASPGVGRPGTLEPTDPWSASAVGFATAQVGKRYCWGGAGPGCFDCSGLVQAAWRWSGVRLPRTSEAQGRALTEIAPEDARPGDILWWPGHVGLYVGGGMMVDAYHSRAGVVLRPAATPRRVLRVLPQVAATVPPTMAGQAAPSF